MVLRKQNWFCSHSSNSSSASYKLYGLVPRNCLAYDKGLTNIHLVNEYISEWVILSKDQFPYQ